MTPPVAVLFFDAVVATALAVDFVLVRRSSTAIIDAQPAVVMASTLAAEALLVEETAQFIGIALIVMLSALFAYANFNAFVKRGITFSILRNHARPTCERRPDGAFIAIEERLTEMQAHRWVDASGGTYRLSERGRRVVRLRRLLLRVLRVKAVG